jgi:hypothetical protein
MYRCTVVYWSRYTGVELSNGGWTVAQLSLGGGREVSKRREYSTYEHHVGRVALQHSTGEWKAAQQSTGGGTEVSCLLEDAQICKAIYRKKYICTEICWRRGTNVQQSDVK